MSNLSQQAKNIDARDADVGIIGDNTNVEGGIHFHSHNYPVSKSGKPIQLPSRAIPFINRKSELDQLLNNLKPGKVITLWGSGGVGKSALAAEAIWSLTDGSNLPESFPDGIIVHDFYDKPYVSYAMEHIVRSFGQEPLPTPKEALRRVLAGKNALILLDGTENADDLPKLLDLRSNCCFLITTRKRQDVIDQQVDVGPLSIEDSLSLLINLAPKQVSNDQVARKICSFVGGLPLAVRLIGRYLRDTQQDAKEYLEWLLKSPLKALDLGNNPEDSIRVLLEQNIIQLSQLARDVLTVVGYLALAPFDRKVISVGMNVSEQEAGALLGELVRFGLLGREDNHYLVKHSLIHVYARNALSVSDKVVNQLVGYYKSLFIDGILSKDRLFNIEKPHAITILGKLKDRKDWQNTYLLSSTISDSLHGTNYQTEFATVLEARLDSGEALGYTQNRDVLLTELSSTYSVIERESKFLERFPTFFRSELGQIGFGVYEQSLEKKVVANRYEVVNRFEGGMGIVYLCHDRFTNELVALKTFKPEFLSSRVMRDLFLREGTMWVELGSHPHIVQAYRVERIGDGREVYLVLEWIVQPEDKTTPSLRAWLQKGNPLSLEQAVLFSLHVARGMKYATRKLPGLVHRDLKPENILVGHDGLAQVTDFGLAGSLAKMESAKHFGNVYDRPEFFNRTQLIGDAVGTPLYMAPEQWLKLELNASTDIYALGCIFYEMVTGRFAAEGKDRNDLREIHLHGRIKPPDVALPRAVQLVLRKCLAVNPIERFLSWDEVENALTGLYRNLFGRAVPEERITTEETRNERLRTANSYNSMGLSYLDIGKLDVAVMYFEQVVNIARRENSPETEGMGLGNLGRAYTSLGYIDRAIELSQEHLSIAHKLGNRDQEASALGILGRAYRQSREPEKSIRYHEKELLIAHELADRFKEAAALHSLGESYRQVGNADKTVSYYKQSLAIARDIGDLTRLERILNSMGQFYIERGDSKEAETLFKQTLEIARQIGDRVGEGEAWGNLGALYQELGQMDRALEYYQHALFISHENKDRGKLFHNLMRLGNVYQSQNNIDEAKEYFDLALETAQEMGDLNRAMEAHAKIGAILTTLGDYFEAARFQRQALRLAQEMGNQKQEEESLQELSRAYDAWGDYGRAIGYLEQTRYMMGKRSDPHDQSRYYSQLAELYRKSTQWKPAMEAYEMVLGIARNLSDVALEVESLNHMASIAHETKDTRRAMEYLKSALELSQQRRFDVGEAATLSNMGMIHQDIGKKWQAVRHLEKAVEVAKKSRRSNSMASASYKLAKVLSEQQRWDKAEPHARLAQQIYTKMGKPQLAADVGQLLADIEKNKGRSTGFFPSDFLRSSDDT